MCMQWCAVLLARHDCSFWHWKVGKIGFVEIPGIELTPLSSYSHFAWCVQISCCYYNYFLSYSVHLHLCFFFIDWQLHPGSLSSAEHQRWGNHQRRSDTGWYDDSVRRRCRAERTEGMHLVEFFSIYNNKGLKFQRTSPTSQNELKSTKAMQLTLSRPLEPTRFCSVADAAQLACTQQTH